MARRFEEYTRPQTVADAVRLLKEPEAFALAGGTELLAHRPADARIAVDLQDLPLNYVHQDADGLHVGALTTLDALATHSLADAISGGLLARCARLSATTTERRAATIGGTLATAGWSEMLLALIATDAWTRVMWSGGVEVVPVDTLVGDRQAWLELGSLITEVLIPTQPDKARFGNARVSRTPRDKAIVAAAVRIARDDEGCVCSTRLAVGGASVTAVRLEAAENELNGRALNPSEVNQVAEAARRLVSPVGDWLASAEYRRDMSAVVVRRALENALA